MSITPPRFLMGLETECLTLADGRPAAMAAIESLPRLMRAIAEEVPTLPGAMGVFTGYGRVYADGRHLELATAECVDPFQLVSVAERLQMVVKSAVRRLRSNGPKLRLANCNHSGLLRDTAPTWGSHGNYLVEVPPETLANQLLPFLATRVYTGAGGVHWPSGEFLAGVRLLYLEQEQGGNTTCQRALHSTSRREHLTSDPRRYGYRYHTLLGDGVRSHLSLLLRFGTTALVLKALIDDPLALTSLPGSPADVGLRGFWMRSLGHFNRLHQNDETLKMSHLACRIQQLYLQAADRFVQKHPDCPGWTRQILAIWESTLNAMERNDQAWLEVRLDPWIKFRLFREYLKARNASWDDLRSDQNLASGLALLNQQYHEFTNPNSTFDQLDRAGLLKHSVIDHMALGEEAEPFVPEVATRAVARARFIREHACQMNLRVDWHTVEDTATATTWRIDDPWASQFSSPVASSRGGGQAV